MLRSFDLVVYAKPVSWHRPGSGKNGGRYTLRIDREARFEIRKAWMEQFEYLGLLPRQTPLRLAVTAYLPAPQGMSKKRRRSGLALPISSPDYDNYAKQVADALQGVAFVNDAQIVTGLARKRYALGPDGEDTPPRWVITLEVIEDGWEAHEGEFAGLFGSGEPDRHPA